MRHGFLVKRDVSGHIERRIIRNDRLFIGSDFENDIVVSAGYKRHQLVRIHDGSMVMSLMPGLRISVRHGQEKTVFDGADQVFSAGKELHIRIDAHVLIEAGGHRFVIMAEDLPRRSHLRLTSDMRKPLLDAHNRKFMALATSVNAVFFGIILFLAMTVRIVDVKPVAADKNKDMQIRYRQQAKPATPDVPAGATSPPAAEKPSAEDARTTGTAPPAVRTGAGLAEGPARVSTGILGVAEGARAVRIAKEKSLLARLEPGDPVDAPVRGKDEIGRPASFDVANAPDVGRTRKESPRVQLEKSQRVAVAAASNAQITVVSGRRSADQILETIAKYRRGMQFVFDDERKKDAELQGKAVILMTISGAGKVTSVQVAETDIRNQAFIERVVTILRNIRFSSVDSGDVSIRLPLAFFPS